MSNSPVSKYVFILILCALASIVKANSTLVKDMVKFDQVYIPVLALTSSGDVKGSRVAFASFEAKWLTFKHKYYKQPVNDSLWKQDFDKVNRYIEASKKIIMRGTDVTKAHEELEHVRVVFMDLRKRNGIDYYIDHLTRFHEPMETIVLAVKGKTTDTLTSRDLVLIKRTLPKALKLWHKTSNSKFDAKLYEFNQTKVKRLTAAVKKEQIALTNLQQAIKANNKEQIIKAGLAIKPEFAKIFKSFGHFPMAK